ncbi:MAG: redoxin domain-containing protein [Balneolaceae bacterium]|nr:redoxin domain-containing protein [Balneolaceae bacterium]
MKKGDKVQDFTLQDTNKDFVSFSEIKGDGKCLVLFFPLAFSSVCTKEVCSVRDNLKIYNSLNAKVLAISVDSLYSLREFKRRNNLSYPLLSDFNKKVSRQFGVFDDDYFGMKGVSKRSAFIINQDMVVEYAEILNDDSQLPDFKAILKVLEA